MTGPFENANEIQANSDEVAEIERHKYFMSEELGYDVGWELAEKDWEEKYAEEFRRSAEVPQRKSGASSWFSRSIGRVFGRTA